MDKSSSAKTMSVSIKQEWNQRQLHPTRRRQKWKKEQRLQKELQQQQQRKEQKKQQIQDQRIHTGIATTSPSMVSAAIAP
ncbi:hypothetical protein IWW40_001881 [Coemansia sp. RSA 1250]|nr:hypothetical protein IWW40_001881 [Coemansia sp. RSA 1250]